MESHDTSPEAATEAEKPRDLERRTFLQTAALAAGATTLLGSFSNAQAQMAPGIVPPPEMATPQAAPPMAAPPMATAPMAAPGTTMPMMASYPLLPRLAEKPLKPAIFTTDGISRRTHEEHFKLYQGYVRKANEISTKLATVSREPSQANQTFSDIREMKVELSFAIGGIKNHELYFDILGGAPGSQPTGALLTEINRSFGSVAAWSADCKATGIAGRGWVWTAYDYDMGRLFNFIGDAQNTFPIWNATPIIGLDVYEHAYAIDYGSNRGAYIDAFLRNLNWNVVGTRFGQLAAPVRNLMTLA